MRQKKAGISKFLIGLGFLTLFSTLNYAQEQKPLGLNLVVIDPGHGGKDPGAIGITGLKEKDVALSVSLKLGKKIREAYPGVKVVYTRADDRFIELAERASIANRLNADLFISIHANSSTSKSPYGTETWVLGLHRSEAALEVAKRENASILMEDNYETTYQDFNPSDPEAYINLALRQSAYLEQSLRFAAKTQEGFRTGLKRKDRGVKQAGFLVLFRATMPAVLIELGFLSNANEESYLRSEKGRNELAKSIFDSFAQYKQEIDEVNKLVENDHIWFGVQIVTSRRDKETKSENFNGLPDIRKFPNGKLFKYTCGNLKSLQEAQSLVALAKEKGYRDAFIVAFNGDDQISVSDAKKRLGIQ